MRAPLSTAATWRGFALRTLKAFRANQGLLLAGAVAYYALLSIVPLLILIVIALSHVIDAARAAEHPRPLPRMAGAGPVERDRRRAGQLPEPTATCIGWVLLATMLFFSSLAFTVLENAMSVIFLHRVAVRRRRFMVSALIPYVYILSLGVGLLLVTLVAGSLQAMGEESVELFGREWSLRRRLRRCCSTCWASPARSSC